MPRPYVPRFYTVDGFCVLSLRQVCAVLAIRLERSEADDGGDAVVEAFPVQAGAAAAACGKPGESGWDLLRRTGYLERARRLWEAAKQEENLRNV